MDTKPEDRPTGLTSRSYERLIELAGQAIVLCILAIALKLLGSVGH